MKTKTALLCATALLLAQPAYAAGEDWASPHHWQVRFRAIDVDPQVGSSGNIAGNASIDSAVVPEMDISYFFNDHVSTELILATSKHNVEWSGPLNLGSVWVLPPTLTAQYHFTPENKLSPYVGAGVNYTVFYNSHPGTFRSVDYKDGFGYALQAGVDYKLDDHWLLNLDAKKIFLNTTVMVNNGAVRADVDVDPWVLGAGFGYRF